MGKKFINALPFNNGLSIAGQTPADDRVVLEGLESLFIDPSSAQQGKDATLYNLAYTGLTVTLFDTARGLSCLMFCTDATPYTPGKVVKIDETNYRTYWNVVGLTTTEYIEGTINPQIADISTYLHRINFSDLITDGNNTGAVSITNNDTSLGQQYQFQVNVDDDTIKIVDDKIVGGKFRIVKLDSVANDNILASYKLSYKAPGASDYSYEYDDDNITIDIPKDFVLNEVHICKGSVVELEDGTLSFNETSTPDSENWEEDTNNVHLHFIWNTKDPSTRIRDTYLCIKDVIGVDLGKEIKLVNTSIANLDASFVAFVDETTEHFRIADTSYDNLSQIVRQNWQATSQAIATAYTTIDTSMNVLRNDISVNLDASVRQLINADTSLKNDISTAVDYIINTYQISLDHYEESTACVSIGVKSKKMLVIDNASLRFGDQEIAEIGYVERRLEEEFENFEKTNSSVRIIVEPDAGEEGKTTLTLGLNDLLTLNGKQLATEEFVRLQMPSEALNVSNGGTLGSITLKDTNNIANGVGSLVIGQNNTTNVANSFVGGTNSQTNGLGSFAYGKSIITSNQYEIALGTYNYTESGKMKFAIGFGEEEQTRRNALIVDNNGDVYIHGVGGYNGTTVEGTRTFNSIFNGYDTSINIIMTELEILDEVTAKADNQLDTSIVFFMKDYNRMNATISEQGDTISSLTSRIEALEATIEALTNQEPQETFEPEP